MSNINLEHGAIGRSIVTAGTTENQNAAMAAYRASRTKSRSSVTGAPASSPSEAEEKTSSATVPLELAPSVEGFKSGAPASSPSEAEEKTSSATVPLELAPSVEGFKSGAAAPPLTVSRGRGFRGESRGRGFRGESRGRGFRGESRGRGFRGESRGRGFRGESRGRGFRGESR